MNKLASPESVVLAMKPSMPVTAECRFEDDDDACILDIDYFVKTLAGIKAKGVRPDLIGSVIAHYASKWLPELSSENNIVVGSSKESPSPVGSVTASWMKKRFFVETLVGILPPEKGSVQCNFLLRLLRVANTVGVDPAYRTELENRISCRLDEATLKELMIPSFCHTCGTLLDVELVIRLVSRFVNCDEANKSGAAGLVKVAKLVDSYLAEAAVDANLMLPEFVGLAGALPGHARATDDGLYRAIDTYLKAHPSLPKHEKKSLCRLIDSRKLSPEAALHAAQNERVPVRAAIQILLSKQTNLNQHIYWSSGSFNGLIRSPNEVVAGVEPPCRSLSRREVVAQQAEIKKLREDVFRLQRQCNVMEGQIEKLLEKKKKGFFWWRKLGMPSLISIGLGERIEEGDMKARVVRDRGTSPKKWRKSM